MTHDRDAWRDWRRDFKGRLPYVRRRVHRHLERRFDVLIDALYGRIPRADEAPLLVDKPVPPGLAGEVCVFVTHAAQPALKAHVAHHVAQLARAGIAVLLVVNTDLPFERVVVPPETRDACAAVLLRANQGLDFAAWAHVVGAWQTAAWERLYLVNDSLVGPLFPPQFERMLGRVRAAQADHLGLTWNTQPRRHLQSFFLVFNAPLLRSLFFRKLMAGVFSFEEKGQVIDFYETRLTGILLDEGYRCESLYPEFPGGLGDAPHLLLPLPELERLELPYVKASLLKKFPGDPRTAAILAQARSDGHL